MAKYQTATQVLLDIMVKEVEEDTRLTQERLDVMVKQNWKDEIELENAGLQNLNKKKLLLKQLIDMEKGSFASLPSIVSISFLNQYRNAVLEGDWESDLLEGPENFYIETPFTLKDYKKLEIDKIYIFDNLRVLFDGKQLLTKYPQEAFWYPLDGSYFERWKDRTLYEMID